MHIAEMCRMRKLYWDSSFVLCLIGLFFGSSVLQNVATAAGYGMPKIGNYLVGIVVVCVVGMLCLPTLANVFVLSSCIFGVYLTSWLAKYVAC